LTHKKTAVVTIKSVHVSIKGYEHDTKSEEKIDTLHLLEALEKLGTAMYKHRKATYGAIDIYEDKVKAVQVVVAEHESGEQAK
jgi:hypothetical protein